jgi:peptide/nickel transport system substrate-binding protein
MTKKSKLAGYLIIAVLLTGIIGLMAASMYFSAPVVAQDEIPRHKTLVRFGHQRGADPENQNPFVPGNIHRWHACQGGHSHLFAEGFGTQWYAATGYSWNDDFTQLTINIRDGVTWNDGEVYNADDVVFTINMLRNTPTLIYAAPFAEWVTDIEATDDLTVVITLKGTAPRFAWRINNLPIVPEHIWKDIDPLTFKNWKPVHAGSHEIISATPEEQIFQRVEDWWGNDVFGTPEMDYVVWKYVPSELVITYMVRNDFDSSYVTSISDMDAMVGENEYIHSWYPDRPYALQTQSYCHRFIMFNHRKYPWSVPEVRWALNLAINKTKVNELGWDSASVYNPYGSSIFPHNEEYNDAVQDIVDEYDPERYDPAEAISILEGLGYTQGGDGIWVTPNGTRLSLTMITWIVSPDCVRAQEAVVEAWKAIGIDAVSKPTDGAALWGPRDQGTFDTFLYWYCWTWQDPYYLFERLHSKYYMGIGESNVANHQGYRNATMDALVEQLDSLPYDMSNPESLAAYRAAFEMYIGDMIDIPLHEGILWNVWNDYYWEGWPGPGNEYSIWDVNGVANTPEVWTLQATGRGVPEEPDGDGDGVVEVVPGWVYPVAGVAVIAIIAAIGMVIVRGRR